MRFFFCFVDGIIVHGVIQWRWMLMWMWACETLMLATHWINDVKNVNHSTQLEYNISITRCIQRMYNEWIYYKTQNDGILYTTTKLLKNILNFRYYFPLPLILHALHNIQITYFWCFFVSYLSKFSPFHWKLTEIGWSCILYRVNDEYSLHEQG